MYGFKIPHGSNCGSTWSVRAEEPRMRTHLMLERAHDFDVQFLKSVRLLRSDRVSCDITGWEYCRQSVFHAPMPEEQMNAVRIFFRSKDLISHSITFVKLEGRNIFTVFCTDAAPDVANPLVNSRFDQTPVFVIIPAAMESSQRDTQNADLGAEILADRGTRIFKCRFPSPIWP